MKKYFYFGLVFMGMLILSGCQKQTEEISQPSQHVATKYVTQKAKSTNQKNYRKFPGFKLAIVPEEFRGTWYQVAPGEKHLQKLVIDKHSVNGMTTYRKVDPNLVLNHNSAKQNRIYENAGFILTVGSDWIKVRGFLDPVNLVYKLGTFKGQTCLYMSYGTDTKTVNGIAFKDSKIALKYRKVDFSSLK